jgi:flagellar basal-body rod protein FlgB
MDTRTDLLARVLDTAATRHKVIAHNVANVNTPGYERLEVTFEDELAKVLAGGGDPSSVKPAVVVDDSAPARADGNTVDIDVEMGQLTKNALLYQAASTILTSRLGTLRSAITGR